MNVELRPAREDELPMYLEQLVEGYAADLVENGGLDQDVARRKSEADNARLFREMFGKRFAFVYDIVVDEDWRRWGIGRRAMELFEGEARDHGFDRIQLNVFGGNAVARSLYRSLGYAMGKTLE